MRNFMVCFFFYAFLNFFNLPNLLHTANRKFALLIGNAYYTCMDELPAVHHDVDDLATELKSLDFRVFMLIDLDHDSFIQELDNFVKMLQAGDYVVFSFSGHGFVSSLYYSNNQ